MVKFHQLGSSLANNSKDTFDELYRGGNHYDSSCAWKVLHWATRQRKQRCIRCRVDPWTMDGYLKKTNHSESLCCLSIYIYTLQGTNISPNKALLKMIFLFRRWDMLIPWRLCIVELEKISKKKSWNFWKKITNIQGNKDDIFSYVFFNLLFFLYWGYTGWRIYSFFEVTFFSFLVMGFFQNLIFFGVVGVLSSRAVVIFSLEVFEHFEVCKIHID